VYRKEIIDKIDVPKETLINSNLKHLIISMFISITIAILSVIKVFIIVIERSLLSVVVLVLTIRLKDLFIGDPSSFKMYINYHRANTGDLLIHVVIHNGGQSCFSIHRLKHF
jgi:hypothetical protein